MEILPVPFVLCIDNVEFYIDVFSVDGSFPNLSIKPKLKVDEHHCVGPYIFF